MANREACELYIEQEIKDGLDAGKKPWTIGKELAGWVERLFEVKIAPRTIEQRARRIDNATNVAEKSQPTETTTYSPPPIIETRKPQGGGTREGAGRPPTPETTEPEKQPAERRTVTRGSYQDWRRLNELSEVVKSAMEEMGELRMDVQHRIPARTMCESFAEKFNKLAQKLVGEK